MYAAVVALLLDAWLGDPPSRFHPVAWMGRWIGVIRQGAPQGSAAASLVYGAVTTGASAGLLGLGGYWLARQLRVRRYGWLFEAAVLSLLLAWRGLMRAGEAVARNLDQDNLAAARHQLGWHLVSRDVSQLDGSLVAAATIESLAENSSDSVVAPLFWFGVGGLPGALVYRFLNTADALLGYRDPEREWLGKSAARLDDIANLIPARLTALLIIASASIAGGRSCRAWRVWKRDACKTAIPNAGHPMSAAAGALGVVLEKTGHYRLGEGLAGATAEDIRRGKRLFSGSILLGLLGVAAAVLIRSGIRTMAASWSGSEAARRAREVENG